MNTITRARAVLVPLVAAVLAGGMSHPGFTADPPLAPAKGPALDTSFLRLYAETRGFTLGRPQKPKVSPDGKTVLFLRAEAKVPKLKLYEFDLASQKAREILSPESILKGASEDLSPEEKARRERQRVSVGGFADYHLDPAGTHILVTLSNTLYVLDRATEKVRELKIAKDGALVDPKWSPDGKRVGYVRGFDVYVYDLETDKETTVTTGGTRVITHGLAEFVAQEEMGRFSGYWWSPDSKSIAYEEADHTGVEQWFVADPLRPEVPPSPQYYPRPGKKNVSVRLGIKPVDGGDTVWVEWGRPFYEYLAAVRWDRAGPLTIQLQDRAQQELALARVNPVTGTISSLRIEKAPQNWVNLPPGELPRWRADGKSFLWAYPEANAGGLNVAYFDDTGKHLLHLAFDHQNEMRELSGFDPVSGRVVGVLTRGSRLTEQFQSSAEEKGYLPDPNPALVTLLEYRPGPRQRDSTWSKLLWRPGRAEELGALTAVFNPDLSLAVLTDSSLDHLPRSTVYTTTRDNDGHPTFRRLNAVPGVAAESPFLPNVTVQKIGDYSTAIVRPRDFDPKKKYPVVVDVYGGPRHLHVVQAMRNWLVPQWLADQGFIVVAIDNRGTPGRGDEWEKAIYQKFGTVPLDDQVKGLAALCDKFPELDRERVGIVGWSFGGYMAANGVLRRPDVFKAAVAGAPVTDWEDYDSHYTERYMGLLPQSKAAYDEASLIPLASKLDRPLLLVHGTADDNVYYRHTLKLSDALFRAGRPFESLALPGVTHMYSADPVVMERLWAKTAGFFRQHLGGPK